MKNFNLVILKVALIDKNQIPMVTTVTHEEIVDFKIVVSNDDVFPLPTFKWYLNNEPISLEQRNSSTPLTHIVAYQARLEDNEMILSCLITQTDDLGNKVESRLSTTLKVLGILLVFFKVLKHLLVSFSLDKNCGCSKYGAISNTCHPMTRQCLCHKNFKGLRCDSCSEKFFDYPICHGSPGM